MFGIPLNYLLGGACLLVGLAIYFRGSLGSLLAPLGNLRLPSLGGGGDTSDLAALKALCKRYKNDPEGHAAIRVLKQRFLLVPGAVE